MNCSGLLAAALAVLARLVALKDGPRDEQYAVEKVRAWEDARRVLLRAAHEPPADVQVDREALKQSVLTALKSTLPPMMTTEASGFHEWVPRFTAALAPLLPAAAPGADADKITEDESGGQWYADGNLTDDEARHALVDYLRREAEIPPQDAWATACEVHIIRCWWRYRGSGSDDMVVCDPGDEGASYIATLVPAAVPEGEQR